MNCPSVPPFGVGCILLRVMSEPLSPRPDPTSYYYYHYDHDHFNFQADTDYVIDPFPVWKYASTFCFVLSFSQII